MPCKCITLHCMNQLASVHVSRVGCEKVAPCAAPARREELRIRARLGRDGLASGLGYEEMAPLSASARREEPRMRARLGKRTLASALLCIQRSSLCSGYGLSLEDISSPLRSATRRCTVMQCHVLTCNLMYCNGMYACVCNDVTPCSDVHARAPLNVMG